MKKLVVKILILLVIVFLGQIIVGRYIVPSISFLTFGMSGIGKLDTYLYQNDKFPTLYFGDSVIKSFDDNDIDKSSIASMLESELSSGGIGDMSSPSYHLGMFEAMMKHIHMSPNKPKAIIIPINLRSFAPLWDKQPEYEFKNEIFFLTHNKLVFYFGKPINIWHAISFAPKSEKDFHTTPIMYNGVELGTVGSYIQDLENKKPLDYMIKESYQFFYLYNLKDNHPKLNSLRTIMNLAKQDSIKLYVYIVPIDYQDGVKYVGKDLGMQISKNADVVCGVLKEGGIPCLNLAKALPSEDFAHPGLPNEHLKESGRRSVSAALSKFIGSTK